LENPSQSRFGPFLIDVRERVLLRDGQPVPLTPKAFDLLAALVAQPGRLISKEDLLNEVWPGTFVEESNLAYNVFALRKALGDPAENGQYIATVPKRGYRFTATVTPADPANAGQPSSEGTAELGRKAFTGGSRLSILAGGNQEPAPPSRLTTSVLPDVEKTVLPFLRKDPARRYQTMADAKVVLEDLDSNSTGTAQSHVPPRSFAFSRRWALLLLAPVLAAGYFVVQSQRMSNETLHALPLTSLQGVMRSPSLSPDGSFVVFSWTGPKQDNPDIYVQQIGAGSPHRLTNDLSNDYSPSWSPDGRTIAFLRRAPAGGISEVRVIAPLGGTERKVGEIRPRMAFYRPLSLAWCPDSRCVLVTDSPGEGKWDTLFLMALDTGEKRQLIYPEGQVLDVDPAISPDGRSLIFRRDTTPFSGAFYRVSLTANAVPDGEQPVRLTSTLSAGKPGWTPDSREILFAARGALWRLDARSGGTPIRLPFVGQDGLTPVVSRTADGQQRLVYVRSFADGNVWRVDTSAAGAPASTPPVAAIASTRSDQIPNLSPDGLQVAFVSNRSGESEIWVAAPDGSNADQLTSLGMTPGFPRWSPDGKLIAFHGDPEGRPDILLVPSRGGTPRNLTTDMPNGGFPSFSRDGQWIYFTVVKAGEPRIWKMPVLGGAAVQVTNNTGTMAIESHDGRDLYYVERAERPSSVWRLPLGRGVPVKVLDGVILGNFDVVEGGIYYIDRLSSEVGVAATGPPSGETRLQYLDFATGQSTTVARNLGTVGFGLSASPGGRTIFFSRVDSSVDELMRVENFR
jgi:Tol biopolymer transport system component/DNA-binding winged helix-turn-helix (wHTH) protein